MSANFLSVVSLERRLSTGNTEELIFCTGVNVVIGRPNTGKTKWLQTLDFLFGDQGSSPYEAIVAEGLSEKYVAAGAVLRIGAEQFYIERRWKELGAKGKVFVDDVAFTAKEFQQWLMDKLGIPLVHYPKGNPMSGQTWPELSFRTLLRHIYRQQRFWGGLADQQSDSEQHASLLQFLGLAEHVYSADFGELISKKLELSKLKSRYENYTQTLTELAGDLLADEDVQLGVNETTIIAAQQRLESDLAVLQENRRKLLMAVSERSFTHQAQSRVSQLGHRRATALEQLTITSRRSQAADERLREVQQYRRELLEEIERMKRASDAAAVLSDLQVTHCPACDQVVAAAPAPGHCFVCHQHLPAGADLEELGAVRLRFEQDRLAGELLEAEALVEVLGRDVEKHKSEIQVIERELRDIDFQLAPARQAVSALAQMEISALDVSMGELTERRRQLDRVISAYELGKAIISKVKVLDAEILPLGDKVERANAAIDFDAAAQRLEGGMNEYLSALNRLRPGTWKHSPVHVHLTKTSFSIHVGNKRWQGALGGTDSLYFLMSYHYGLLALSGQSGTHYPGLSIIDVPGEFSGEAVEDKENFIVQPFIDLLSEEKFAGAQLIITGASFAGLQGVHCQKLSMVHVA